MEMHQIRYFLAVSQTLNFTRAAEECHVSQSALTRAIKVLETELGGELIRRERTLSHLTELGHSMLPLMKQCYESALSAKTLAQSVKTGESTSLTIAVSRTVDVEMLTRSLHELSRAYPGVQIRLDRANGSEIAELLKKNEAEIAIAGPIGDGWDRLDVSPLFRECYGLAVSRDHRLACLDEVELAQLSGERFLVQTDCEMAEDLSRQLSENGIAFGGTYHVTTDHDLAALLKANLGIAIIPASVSNVEGLRRAPVKGLDLTRTVAIYTVAGRRRSPVATLLVNLLRAADWSRYGELLRASQCA